MRRAARFMLVALITIAAVVLVAFGQTISSVVALAAAACASASCPGTVFIVKGTNSAFNQLPDSAYPQFAHDYDAAVGAPAPLPVTTPYPYFLVPYPATLFPVTPPGYITSPTLDQSVAAGVTSLESSRPVSSTEPGDVVWGYSQGATVVTQYKRDFNAAQPSNPTAVPPTFVLVANPNRPNGGILERGVAFGTIPVFGITFNGATPTETAGVPKGTITTYDVARQYDGIADAPENPLNVLADANAAMGFYYLHGKYASVDPTTAINQGSFGDTQYYLIPTYPLPLLMPLESVPGIGFPLADTLDPALRVLVESAYDRNTSPGVPTPANPLFLPDPVVLGTNLLIAIPTGLDNGISDFTAMRPFGTARPGAYGVGGPPTPVPAPTPTSPTIPVLFSSPAGGFLAMVDPTTLGSDLQTFSQLTGITNGGSLASPFSAPAGPSGPDPGGSSPNTVIPATFSPADTSGTTPQFQSSKPDSPSIQNTDVKTGGTKLGNISSTPPATPPANGGQSNDPNTVWLNVPRNSLIATPGGSPGSSGGSQSGLGPIGSVVSGVTSSVQSALAGLGKAATGGSTGTGSTGTGATGTGATGTK
ncbi:MAG: PE-PPE domain-containing protein [Mycobacteriaceae bacterium]|nr:PE-PPE domain-containing protein [Mycobacteriaceae bacterium]